MPNVEGPRLLTIRKLRVLLPLVIGLALSGCNIVVQKGPVNVSREPDGLGQPVRCQDGLATYDNSGRLIVPCYNDILLISTFPNGDTLSVEEIGEDLIPSSCNTSHTELIKEGQVDESIPHLVDCGDHSYTITKGQ